MAHIPRSSTEPYHPKIDRAPEAQLSPSATESPSRSASKILFTELDVLCDILRDLETKIEERLAPIMLPLGSDALSPAYPPASDFSPLFHELFTMIRAAQDLAGRNHNLIDRVDNL